MSTEKWIAGSGQGLTFGNAYTSSTLNALANNSAIISDLQIDNSSALDMFADISFRGASVTTTGVPFIGVYIYPLLDDNSTYGDGKYGSAAAGPPPSIYQVGVVSLPVGTQAITGLVAGIVLPPAKFKFCIWNQAGVA